MIPSRRIVIGNGYRAGLTCRAGWLMVAGTVIFPIRKSDLLWREVENEVVVLDRGAGKVHQLNQTAADIWRWCDGRKSLADIVASVAREYSVPEAEVKPDVTRVVNELGALGLLQLLPQAADVSVESDPSR